MEYKEYLAQKTNRKRPIHEESNIQIAVANYLRAKYPKALFTIAPSGIKLGIRTAKRLKAMGYAAGTPDLLIFEPRGRFHGLMLELKKVGGQVSKVQKAFLRDLHDRGYREWVAFGYLDAVIVIDQYLNEFEEVK